MARVSLVLSQKKKERWECKLQKSNKYSNMSDFVRKSVEKEINRMDDDNDVEESIESSIDDEKIEQIESLIKDLDEKIESIDQKIESSKENTESEISDDIIQYIPNLPVNMGFSKEVFVDDDHLDHAENDDATSGRIDDIVEKVHYDKSEVRDTLEWLVDVHPGVNKKQIDGNYIYLRSEE